MYKVGKVTDFGTLLAEAVKGGDIHQTTTFSLYAEESEYKVIEWYETEYGDEFEIDRTYFSNLDEAIKTWTKLTFG